MATPALKDLDGIHIQFDGAPKYKDTIAHLNTMYSSSLQGEELDGLFTDDTKAEYKEAPDLFHAFRDLIKICLITPAATNTDDESSIDNVLQKATMMVEATSMPAKSRHKKKQRLSKLSLDAVIQSSPRCTCQWASRCGRCDHGWPQSLPLPRRL